MGKGLAFDETSAGSIEGIHDAGVETFMGNPLPSLAREQAQNALDARREGLDAPVQIEYKLRPLLKKDFPGESDLSRALDDLIKFWADRTSKEDATMTTLQQAKKVLGQPTIPILCITDRNTTGLTGSERVDGGNWIGLTKATGLSAKAAGKGGSFGIGKSVFWANSRLRTIFFSTHDMEDKWAFQGVTKLAGLIVSKRLTYRATAYYGETSGYAPIKGELNIPPFFRPTGVGTNVYVAGFEVKDDWDLDLIEAFAENFFVAFYNNKLELRVEDEVLTKETIAPTLAQMYEENPKRDPSLRNYFDALTSSEARVFEEDLPGLGKVTLRLLVREGANKRILAVRATGMRIKELSHFRTPVQFAGVLECTDDIGNQFLRSIEPPAHNDWEADRHATDPKQAKRTLDGLTTWVRAQVASLSQVTDQEELDVPDLGHLLPDDTEPVFDALNHTDEGELSGKEEELKGHARRKTPEPKTEVEAEQGVLTEDGDDPSEVGVGPAGDSGTGSGEGGGQGQDGGDDPKPPEGDGTRGDGPPKTEGGGDAGGGTTTVVEVPGLPSRVFRLPGTASTYRLIMSTDTAGDYGVSVAYVGDDAKAIATKPTAARLLDGVTSNPIQVTSDGRMLLPGLAERSRVVVDIDLPVGGLVSLKVRTSRNG